MAKQRRKAKPGEKPREFIPDCADCQREKPIKFYVVLVKNDCGRAFIYGFRPTRAMAKRLLYIGKKIHGWTKVVKCEVRA